MKIEKSGHVATTGAGEGNTQQRCVLCGASTELTTEMAAYLDSLTITSDNIGDIRRSCFVPWQSRWNGIVRDETAKRELSPATVAEGSSTPTTGEGAREIASQFCEGWALPEQAEQELVTILSLAASPPTKATQVAVEDTHGDTQQFFDRLLADSRQWLDEKFTKGWSAEEAAKEIRAEFKRKFVIPTEQELVAIISKYCPADAGGVVREAVRAAMEWRQHCRGDYVHAPTRADLHGEAILKC